MLKYTDFREFLKDYIEKRKKNDYGFSLRFLASKMECNPGFLHRIIKGERKLSNEYHVKLLRFLKLPKKDEIFFNLLMNYNQAKKENEKEYYYNELLKFKNSHLYTVNQTQYALYGSWLNIALRELINIIPIYNMNDNTCKKLAQHISPKVKMNEIKKSLQILIDTGIITKKVSGRYSLYDKVISTGLQIPTFTVQNILEQFFKLGKDAIKKFTKSERIVSTVTVSLSNEGYDELQQKCDEFRKEVLRIAENDRNKLNRIYHMNLQLFPLTNLIGDKK